MHIQNNKWDKYIIMDLQSSLCNMDTFGPTNGVLIYEGVHEFPG